MKRVIFLDFDGVVHNRFSQEQASKGIQPMHFKTICYGCTVDPACVLRLQTVVQELDIDIVITSTWRRFPEACTKALRWGGWLLRKPFSYTAVNSDKRGKQIADWLALNPVDAFVILDDDPIELFQDRVVYTDNQLGLTDADVVKIRQLFYTA